MPSPPSNQGKVQYSISQWLELIHCMTRSTMLSIKEWKNGYFESSTLKRIGLRIQLGHACEERCADPQRAFADDFVVIDIHGVHDAVLDYRGCERVEVKHVQLLRSRLFSTTSIDSKTAWTFRLLKLHRILHNETKASGFEFYATLARRSNNTGTEEVKVSVSHIGHRFRSRDAL